MAYRDLIEGKHIRQLYLDELRSAREGSLGLRLIGLVTESEETAAESARILIERARAEAEEPTGQALIDLIEQMVIYMFPRKSREEVAKMLGLAELKQTRVYQEAKEEGLMEGLKEGFARGTQEGFQGGQLSALLEGIAEIVDLKFGLEGTRLLPEINKIQDVGTLRAILRAAGSARTVEELRSVYRE